MIIYNGAVPCRHSREVFPLFGKLESLAREVFLKPFTLIDVALLNDDDIRKHQWAGLMELSLCRANRRQFDSFMRMTAEMFDITQIKVDDEVVGLVLKYNMNKYGDARTDPNTYIDTMREMLPPEFEETSMSIAKALEARGKKEGIVIGKTEGIAIGEARGIDHTLQAIELLKSGTHSLDEIAQKTELPREAVEKLQHSMLN